MPGVRLVLPSRHFRASRGRYSSGRLPKRRRVHPLPVVRGPLPCGRCKPDQAVLGGTEGGKLRKRAGQAGRSVGRGHPDLRRLPSPRQLSRSPGRSARVSAPAALPKRCTAANGATPFCIGWAHVSYTPIGVSCQGASSCPCATGGMSACSACPACVVARSG